MQTFLISPNFSDTAKVLDNQRLNKQIIEARQIFQVVSGKSKGWASHPAVKQWMGFPIAISDYYMDMVLEAGGNRGMNPSIDNEIVDFANDNATNPNPPYPAWITDERVHISHKSRLLFKGRVDAVCYSLRSHLQIRSINNWLEANGYPQKNVFKLADIERLESFAEGERCTIRPNHYEQFGWDVPRNLSYFWPSKENET